MTISPRSRILPHGPDGIPLGREALFRRFEFACHCERERSNLHPVTYRDGDCRVASLLAMTGNLTAMGSTDAAW
jgi:hypothetical protein